MEMIESQEKSKLKISNFILKLIAIITMTFDHVGYILQGYYFHGWLEYLPLAMRTIGRLSLPLFCFCIAEGIRHTRSIGKYMLRLGIVGSIISLSYIIIDFVPFFHENGIVIPKMGNIFLDLILGGLGAYLISNKNKGIKALAILPIAFGIVSYAVDVYEINTSVMINWLPYYVRTQGGWYGIVLIIGFCLSYSLSDLFFKWQHNLNGLDPESLKDTTYGRAINNIMACLVLIIVSLILFVVHLMGYTLFDIPTQNACMLAGLFIFFYSGKRGYNKKWFNIVSYIYYPMHFILLFLIFTLLLGM